MAITLVVNGIMHTVEVEPETPLLWVIRDTLKLTGTKFSCGMAQCGACTVLIDSQPIRSCSFPVSAIGGAPVTTIEGLSPTDAEIDAMMPTSAAAGHTRASAGRSTRPLDFRHRGGRS